MRKVLKVLVDSRMIILSVLGVSLYLAISQYHISLWKNRVPAIPAQSVCSVLQRARMEV